MDIVFADVMSLIKHTTRTSVMRKGYSARFRRRLDVELVETSAQCTPPPFTFAQMLTAAMAAMAVVDAV